MISKLQPSKQIKRHPNLWLERAIALLATVNFGLVLFDYSYIPEGNFYLKYFPDLTLIYDRVKGIEPDRETENYLNQVQILTVSVKETGLQSKQTAASLEQLRRLSVEMIENNLFAVAGKTGTLEKIKNRMGDRRRSIICPPSFLYHFLESSASIQCYIFARNRFFQSKD